MKDPVAYENKYSDNHEKVAQLLVPALLKGMNWKSEEVVLDFGCGSGGLTKNLVLPEIEAQMPPGGGGTVKILGVDISESGIAYAEETHPHPKINYKVMDILLSGAEFEGYFDKILSFHAFNWIPEIKPTLRVLHKMLKPGGEIGFFCLITNNWRPALFEAQQDPEFGECFHMVSAVEDYVPELKSCNFEIIDSRVTKHACLFETAEKYMGLLMSLGIFRAPAGKELPFKKFVLEAFKSWIISTPTPEFPKAVTMEIAIENGIAKKI